MSRSRRATSAGATSASDDGATAPRHRQVDDAIRAVRIGDNGTVYARGTKFQTTSVLAGQIAYMTWETETIQIFDDQGTLIVEYPWPKPGTKYVGSGNSRGRRPRTH